MARRVAGRRCGFRANSVPRTRRISIVRERSRRWVDDKNMQGKKMSERLGAGGLHACVLDHTSRQHFFALHFFAFPEPRKPSLPR